MSSKFLDKTGLDTLWAKIKSTFQTLGNLVTAWGSTPSDTKYPSEKLVKESLDAISTNARTIPQDVSKGANLVVNGSGRMASNYNFSSFSYVPTISYGGSAGSFGYNATNAENEYISCDFNKKVVFSADVKNLVAQPSNCIHRVYVLEFDIDKKSIQAIHVMYGVGTLTELTQDLNPGDTVVHLADLSNANWLSATTYHRGFIFWNYQNSYGYLYPPETYSRNVYPSGDSNPLWDVANVNVSAGTITLNSGWTGPAIPAGTKVSRRSSGNTFPYPTSVTTGDTEWHSMKGYMKGIASPGTSERSSTKFSQGTAFIRAGICPSNLDNTDPVINKRAVVANFAIYEEQDINDGFGTLPVNRGGTGKTSITSGYYLVGNGTGMLTERTPTAVGNNVLTNLPSGSDDVLGTDYIIGSNHTSGATDTTQFVRRTADKLWNYIKSRISSVLGLTATAYGGNAATATTAAGYTSGGAIDTALQGKVDKVSGKGLSTNDFTTDEKDKLAGIASGAEVNVQSDWNQTDSTADDYIKNKPQNLVQDASYVHTDNNYTTAEKTKLSGIAEGAEVNVQSDWNQTDSTADDYIKNKPTVSRYFNKYSGGTSVYGWKIGSTVTRNIDGVSSIITGVFTLALGIRVENAPQESTAVKTMATMVGFFSCYARYESGANVVKARIYTPVSSIFNATYNIKYIDEGNGKFTWVLGFGTGTTPISKDFVHCSVNVMSSINADFENFGDAITSAPTYPSGAYFTVFKSPVIGQNTSGVGDATKPVYADTNGFIKECTSVNADTVDGFHFSTSTSGSATNTVYLV